MRTLAYFFIAALIYFAAARLGLLFAIPPGFASAIWPAAGIALALYIYWGTPALLGALAGSFVAIFSVFNEFSSTNISLTTVIVTGIGLQLFVARWLTLRVFPNNISLNNLHSIVQWFMIIGPTSCMISATIGTSAQLIFSEVSLSDAYFIWFTWWIGDTLGVLYFGTLLLSLNRLSKENIKNRVQIIVPSLVIFIIVCVVFLFSRQNQFDNQGFKINENIAKLQSELNRAKDDINNDLASLSAFLSVNSEISRIEFATFAQAISGRYPIYRGLEWIPLVSREERQAYEESVAADGFPGFTIKGFNSHGELTRSPDNDFYFPVTFIEPFLSNEAALGLDLASNSDRLTAIEQTIANNSYTATSPITLVQEQLKRSAGVLVFAPIYHKTLPDKSLSNLNYQRNVKGMVLVVVDMDKVLLRLLNESGLRSNFNDIRIKDQQNEFFSYQGHGVNIKEQQIDLNWFGREWQISIGFSSKQLYGEKDWQSWLVMTIGFVLAIVAFIFIFIVTSFNSQLERQVKQSTLKLSRAIERSKASNEAKSIFLANMSHEFRTPLNAIMGFTRLGMEASSKDHQLSNFFSKINDASSSLLTLVNDILDWAKLDAGKLSVDPKPFDFLDFTSKLESLFTFMARDKGLEFNIFIQGELIHYLNGDESRLLQIMTNLCSNAIKFTDKGSVTVLFSFTRLDEHNTQLYCSVTDTGVGIADKDLKNLFQAFSQADSSNTRKYEGTGLGLSIAGHLVTMMDSEILVSSKVSKGSCFNFTIKLPIEVNVPEIAEQQALALDLSGKTILLVEDNMINQQVALAQLSQYKAKVMTTVNGKEAIDYLHQHSMPDLILMDMQMPVMDGYEATEIIKNDPKLQSIPVIALSANAQPEDIKKAMNMGVDEYLTKPMDSIRLTQLLHIYLR